MKELLEIQAKINDIIDEHGEAFFEKGIKARSSKIRKGLSEIGKLVKEGRKTVQDHRNILDNKGKNL